MRKFGLDSLLHPFSKRTQPIELELPAHVRAMERFRGKFLQKSVQYEVFREISTPMPQTILATDFHGQFYPAVVKTNVHSIEPVVVNSPEEFQQLFREKTKEGLIVQELIQQPTALRPNTWRVLVKIRHHDEPVGEKIRLFATGDIVAVIIAYNPQQGGFATNIRRGGVGIPVVGPGNKNNFINLPQKDVQKIQEEILQYNNVDPNNRQLPQEIIDSIFKKHEDGSSVFTRTVDCSTGGPSSIGFDFIYGCPAGSQTQQKDFYLLEVNVNPGTEETLQTVECEQELWEL